MPFKSPIRGIEKATIYIRALMTLQDVSVASEKLSASFEGKRPTRCRTQWPNFGTNEMSTTVSA